MSWKQRIVLLLLLGYYSVATLPYIDRSPRWSSAEIALIAPAYQLATTGRYGNPIYRGFYRTEQRNYEFMPLHPLQLAAVIKLFGANSLPLRLLSYANGLAAVILLFILTRRLHDIPTALASVAALVGLRLGSSIPHVDLAQIVHYDILVPVWVLAACLFWISATSSLSFPRRWESILLDSRLRGNDKLKVLVIGICAGLATLAHVYGAFVLAIPLVMGGWRLVRSGKLFWMLGGWGVTMLPFLLYIAQDFAAYRGQMSRHRGRFDLLNWRFYSENLQMERLRFATWFGDAPLFNIGLLILICGVILTHVVLILRQHKTSSERFTLVSLGAVWLPLALLISFKRYAYVALLMPFFALQVGYTTLWIWRRGTFGRAIVVGLTIMAFAESVVGVVQDWSEDRSVVRYETMMEPIAAEIPDNAFVMGIPLFWMGLRDRDFVGLDLAFVDEDATETLFHYTPDLIIVQDHLLYQYQRNPGTAPRPELETRWEAIIQFIDQHCETPRGVSKTADYGQVLLTECDY